MEEELRMLHLFVVDADSGEKIAAVVREASEQDLAATRTWQTSWETPFAVKLPNKVALHRADDGELLGLVSYELDAAALAVELSMWKVLATATRTSFMPGEDANDASELICLCDSSVI